LQRYPCVAAALEAAALEAAAQEASQGRYYKLNLLATN